MLHEKSVRSVLNKMKKRDDWFLTEYSVNPYEGCSCNCLYCYIRGSKYGENLADHLTVKTNVLEVFAKQLYNRAKKGQYGFIAVGSATDTYMHQEESLELTRGILEIILHYRFPVFIGSKRSLILRDIELLKKIDRDAILPPDLQGRMKHGAIVSVSVSSMDEQVAGILESGADTPLQRMQTLQQLTSAGLLTGVNAMPLLPYISDSFDEMEKIFAAAKTHGASYIFPAGLTLFGDGPSDSKTLFYKFLERYNPSLLPLYRRVYDQQTYPSYAMNQLVHNNAVHLHRKYQLRNHILAV